MLDCILAKRRTMHRLTSRDKHTEGNVKYMCPDISYKYMYIYINTSIQSSISLYSLIKRTGGRFTKSLKITIHTWDIFIPLGKHHRCHCMPTNYSYNS